MVVRLLIDWRFRYGYHGRVFLRSHWVTGALGEDETTMTTRTRNTGLTRLLYVVFMSFQRSLAWWVFMGGWQTFCVAREEMGYLCYRRNSQTFLSIAIMETNIGNMSNAPGLILTTNASKINVNAWADCAKKFSSSLNGKKKCFFLMMMGSLFCC